MQHTKTDVLGIGNAIVDVLARTDDDFLAAHKLDKGTMHLIDEQTATSLYEAMGPGVEISGGSAANTIAGLASFGASTAFVGKVRDDQLGQVFGHDIRALGTRFETAPATDGAATARCLILVTSDGQRTMNTFLGASIGLGPDDIEEDAVAGAGITYLEGYLWDPPEAKEAFVKAARIARGAGRQVALSLSDPFCVDRHRTEFRKLIKDEVDILFANEVEICSLYETESFDDALQAARLDCRLAALTRSEHGCVIVEGQEVHVVPAAPVDKVVDTTGAGDQFAAGFLFGLTRNQDLKTCGQLGALAAAEVIGHMGARPEIELVTLARKHAIL
ncbi:adenosine kinase [Kaustia mangrovi]|uniref:Adenosine kinase n=1 Tax=Kaustia mangrovi TaxID=2593653 RepID=A0A7S8C4Q9_9HYPH|nr:adenosine kinase [Kaustia mangrovi]QPC43374.1 adenosine kinase [Kaustia mangrovi]